MVILFCIPNVSREIHILKKAAFLKILIYLQKNEFSKHLSFYKLTIHQAINMTNIIKLLHLKHKKSPLKSLPSHQNAFTPQAFELV